VSTNTGKPWSILLVFRTRFPLQPSLALLLSSLPLHFWSHSLHKVVDSGEKKKKGHQKSYPNNRKRIGGLRCKKSEREEKKSRF